MTEKDYKKAWAKFKKAMIGTDDKLGLKGCCYMTAQQICNKTATIDLGSAYAGKWLNHSKEKANTILESEAFQRLSDEICIKRTELFVKENAYYQDHLYLRINY